jgi:hypothetical protein
MNRVMIDSAADSPRVIIVERRSILSQIGGIWLVALPLIAAYAICRVPYELAESPVPQLRLGDNSWQYPASTPVAASTLVAVVSPVAEPGAPKDEPRVEKASAKTVAVSETLTPPPPSTETVQPDTTAEAKSEQGAVAVEPTRAGLNPVAVFDPEGKAPMDEAGPAKTPDDGNADENRTLQAALNFEGGQPTADETRKALEEINAAAEKARVERERSESLKPLIAMHEEAQAKTLEIKRAEAERRRLVESREAFVRDLGSILSSDASIPQQGRQIDLMIRRDHESMDLGVFDSVFMRLTDKRASRAGKLRFLIQQNVPESLILSYLIELDLKDIRKANGPRDREDAIVRSSKFLYSHIKGQ